MKESYEERLAIGFGLPRRGVSGEHDDDAAES